MAAHQGLKLPSAGPGFRSPWSGATIRFLMMDKAQFGNKIPAMVGGGFAPSLSQSRDDDSGMDGWNNIAMTGTLSEVSAVDGICAVVLSEVRRSFSSEPGAVQPLAHTWAGTLRQLPGRMRFSAAGRSWKQQAQSSDRTSSTERRRLCWSYGRRISSVVNILSQGIVGRAGRALPPEASGKISGAVPRCHASGRNVARRV